MLPRLQLVLPVFTLLAAIAMISACNGTTGPSAGEPSGVAMVTEDIEEPTTWYSDTVYVIMKYDFYVSSTLTIQAGTVVKFHPSDGPYCMLSGSGLIDAQGTSDDPVVFTSYKDDSHGGDTNGDGSASSPAARDWGEINTNGCNGSTFSHCRFHYGGAVNCNATLTIYGDNTTVMNCTFAHNDGSFSSPVVDVGVLDASDAGPSTLIQCNVFYDNVRPLTISTDFDLDDSNTFCNPDDQSETNDYNGIFVYSEDVDSHIGWSEGEVAFVIDDVDFWVESGFTLTLADGVVMKFKSGSVLLLADGESALVNHSGQGVYFTSYRDDSLKGDTNGDGSATSPADGDWVGIYDDSGATPYPYFFSWSNILYDSY